MVCRRRKPQVVLATGLLMLAGQTWAAGYQFSQLSVTGLASAGAIVADPVSVGAVPYDPALMAFHGGQHALIDGVVVDSRLSVDGGQGGAATSHAHMPRLVPDLDYFATGTRWSAGIGLDSPYGLEVDWPNGTFPGGGPYQPLVTKLSVYDLHPMAAYRRGNFAVGLALDYMDVREWQQTTPAGGVQGDGTKPGYSAAIAYQHRGWTGGIRYRSAVTVQATGSAGGLPATTPIVFPWSFQVGLRRQINLRWAAEADFERTGWDRLQSWNIFGPNGSVLAQAPVDWSNANTYRIGSSYDVGRGVHIRFGFAVDRSGASSVWTTAPPDPNRRVYSMGATQDMGPWKLDAGLSYAQFQTVTVASSIPAGAYAGTLNGTNAYNGTYQQHTLMLGIGITRRF